jgi:hypothetical protein
MKRNELITLFTKLGSIFDYAGKEAEYPGYEIGLAEVEYNEFMQLIERVHLHNPWFTPVFVRKALLGLSGWLTNDKLEKWLEFYSFAEQPKRVGLIMAGNIPLVGFHDFLCVIMSGHKAVVKFSSNDNKLWPSILTILTQMDSRFSDKFEISLAKIGAIDAIIATGSDNSANYFEYYFSQYPHIIRKNRTSVAVLGGNETEADFDLLADDVFHFFGLGCRNVSQLFIPQEFDLEPFFKGIYKYGYLANHHKYINNFDYNRAIYLLNQEDVLENGFALVRFTKDLNSPLSVINCFRYTNIEEVHTFLTENKERIQVVVGKGFLPFGKAQQPDLTDYADDVNTLDFLSNLK